MKDAAPPPTAADAPRQDEHTPHRAIDGGLHRELDVAHQRGVGRRRENTVWIIARVDLELPAAVEAQPVAPDKLRTGHGGEFRHDRENNW